MKTNSDAKAEWDRCHNYNRHPADNHGGNLNRGVPSALYTDENPATTIHGLGYKDAAVARRTLRLTSQPGVRYKQYWTVRAMRERAAHHAHPTVGMRDAIKVFDAWLDEHGRVPDAASEDGRAAEEEWRAFRALCASSANQHAYGTAPSREELGRAREDGRVGRELLADLLAASGGRARRRKSGGAGDGERGSDAGPRVPFPITAWTALFGAPGLHGYGRHDIVPGTAAAAVSRVRIDGHDGLAELIGRRKASALALGGAALVGVDLEYDRDGEAVTAWAVELRRPRATLAALWRNEDIAPRVADGGDEDDADVTDARAAGAATSATAAAWTCHACTLEHVGSAKRRFLACELCGTERRSVAAVRGAGDGCQGASSWPGKESGSNTEFREATTTPVREAPLSSLAGVDEATQQKGEGGTIQPVTDDGGAEQQKSSSRISHGIAIKREAKQQKDGDSVMQPIDDNCEAQQQKDGDGTMQPVTNNPRAKPRAMGGLTPQQQWKNILKSSTPCDPTQRSALGKRRRKALEAPLPAMDHIVVLDFEWTADRGRRMEPVAEITQFPSVCLRLSERGRGAALLEDGGADLPRGLRPSPTDAAPRRDAVCISIFDSYVRPTLNPVLTEFSIDLTAITQEMVDGAPIIDAVLPRYVRWLQSLGLVDERGHRLGHWAFATWGDCDIMTTLRLELQCKSIDMPPCFVQWINLKSDSVYKKHYGRAPRGGLRRCVEVVGAEWEGRAHNGLVDSINTAKIVRDMVQNGCRFVRPTRGLDKNGRPFGQRSVEQGSLEGGSSKAQNSG